MNLVCRSVLTLLALYVLYSECITLPSIIKKNKKLVYLLIGFVYLSTYDTVEGLDAWDALKLFAKAVAWAIAIVAVAAAIVVVLSVGGALIAVATM